MIKNILFIGDYYRGDQEKNIQIIYNLFSPIFFDISIEIDFLEADEKYCNKEIWENSLKGIGTSLLENYDLSKTAIIGFEINPIDQQFLIKNAIPWINIEIHPIRFLEDLYFSVMSSFEFDTSMLAQKNSYIKFAANKLKLNNIKSTLNIKSNALLIVGQTPEDKSVYFDGKFKTLLDYIDKLNELSETHENIYYKPHPNLSNPTIDNEIIKRYNAIVLSDENYYDIISSNHIRTICGISSSCLHEGKYFDKKIIFLETKIKKFTKPIKLKTLLECSDLWLKKLISAQTLSNTSTYFATEDNMCRNYFGSWSYETPINKLEQKINYLNNVSTQVQEKATQAEAKANEAEAKANEAEAKANEAEAKANEAEAKATQAEAKASEAEARTNDTLHHYHMVLNSNSWKLTKPYRILGQKYKWFKGNANAWLTFAPSSRPRKTLKKLLLTVKYKLNSHPKIKNKLLRILDRYPTLKKKIMSIGKDNFLNNQTMRHSSYSNQAVNLSPQAKKIYNDLKKEIEMQKRGK